MRADERREQILDVTHRIVEAEGFPAATPNRIADEAGVTRPVLYQQFGDLAGVLVALVDREGERAALQFAEVAVRTGDDEPDPLVRTFAGVLAAIDAHPATWRLFLFPPQGAPVRLHERLAESEERLLAYLRDGLVAALPDLPDPEYSARVVLASGRELLRMRLLEPEAATHERLLALVRRMRVSGDRS